jgi:S1-C subfamily serine protease
MKRWSLVLAAVLAAAAGVAAPPAGAAAPEVGWLGISISDVSEDLAERLGGIFGPAAGNGVHVVEVLSGGPAQQALQRGDVIVQVDAQPVWDVRQLQRVIRTTPVHRQVTLAVLRGSRRLSIPVAIGAMPADARAQLAAERFGFVVRERDESPSGRPTDGSPLIVAFVDPDSPAARAQLRALDRIVQANGRPVSGLADFEEAVRTTDPSLSLLVQRRDAAEPIPLRIDLPRR